jgi:hypothetical protein
VELRNELLEEPRYVHSIGICASCVHKRFVLAFVGFFITIKSLAFRQFSYEETTLVVRLLGDGLPMETDLVGKPNSTATQRQGLRKSRRLRQAKDRVEECNLTVNKSTTVKDIKVMVSLDDSKLARI